MRLSDQPGGKPNARGACGLLEQAMTTRPKNQPLGGTHDADGRSVPRMPHERDESSDQQGSPPREIIQKAHDDAVSGKADTSRAEATDKTYRDNLRGAKGNSPKP